MYHTGKNPLRPVKREGETVSTPKSPAQRRLHKAFLRYHDAQNWPLLRQALVRMGRSDLIGTRPDQLVPRAGAGPETVASGRVFKTQHTGLPKVPRGPKRARRSG
jgi:hypothetical protein